MKPIFLSKNCKRLVLSQPHTGAFELIRLLEVLKAKHGTTDSCAVGLVQQSNSIAQPAKSQTLLIKSLPAIENTTTVQITGGIQETPVGDIALQFVEKVLCSGIALDEIWFTEDLGGRLIQARNTGLLPINITLRCFAIGGKLIAERGNARWMNSEDLAHNELEVIALTQSDQTVFISAGIRRWYSEAGVQIADTAQSLAAPVTTSDIKASLSPINEIVWIGIQERQHGFDDFIATLSELQPLASRINRITIVGEGRPQFPTVAELQAKVRNAFIVDETTVLPHQLKKFIAARISKALFVFPYRVPGISAALNEVVNLGGRWIAYQNEDTKTLRGSSSALCEALAAALKSSIITTLDSKVLSMAPANNTQTPQSLSLPDVVRPQSSQQALPSLTLGIPVFNTELKFLSSLCASIRAQKEDSVSEVIVVDDCSTPKYSQKLRDFLDFELSKINYRIVRHDQNLGLAAARNSCLAATKTDLLLTIDSDDILLPTCTNRIRQAFSLSPHSVAVVPYLQSFNDGVDPLIADGQSRVFRPVGAGLIPCLIRNFAGHANSAFNVQRLRALGGWDDASRTMWEDWQLFLKILSSGGHISVIPKVEVLYRVRGQSMLRTADPYLAAFRLATCINRPLNSYEQLRLVSTTQRFAEYEAAQVSLQNEIARLNSALSASNGKSPLKFPFISKLRAALSRLSRLAKNQ